MEAVFPERKQRVCVCFFRYSELITTAIFSQLFCNKLSEQSNLFLFEMVFHSLVQITALWHTMTN